MRCGSPSRRSPGHVGGIGGGTAGGPTGPGQQHFQHSGTLGTQPAPRHPAAQPGIEHGNLIDESDVAEFRERGALVPTPVTYWALKREGREFGLPESSWRKVDEVLGGVRIAHGSDLLGGMHRHRKEEFRIRGEVQPPIEVIRSATGVAADLLG